MLSFLTILTSSFKELRRFTELDQKTLLEHAQAPSFNTLEVGAETSPSGGLSNVDITISTTFTTGLQQNQYYFSSITLTQSSSFTGCYAFGARSATGSGGAMYISYSMLSTSTTSMIISFSHCQ